MVYIREKRNLWRIFIFIVPNANGSPTENRIGRVHAAISGTRSLRQVDVRIVAKCGKTRNALPLNTAAVSPGVRISTGIMAWMQLSKDSRKK